MGLVCYRCFCLRRSDREYAGVLRYVITDRTSLLQTEIVPWAVIGQQGVDIYQLRKAVKVILETTCVQHTRFNGTRTLDSLDPVGTLRMRSPGSFTSGQAANTAWRTLISKRFTPKEAGGRRAAQRSSRVEGRSDAGGVIAARARVPNIRDTRQPPSSAPEAVSSSMASSSL